MFALMLFSYDHLKKLVHCKLYLCSINRLDIPEEVHLRLICISQSTEYSNYTSEAMPTELPRLDFDVDMSHGMVDPHDGKWYT